MSDAEWRKAAAARARMSPGKRCADCRAEISILNDYGICGLCVGDRRRAMLAEATG